MNPTDVDDLAAAIREFEAALPGWWWSVGSCGLTRDASCGPKPYAMCGPDCFDDVVSKAELERFDKGFDCDDPNGTVASSLRYVMKQALKAKAEMTEPEGRPAPAPRSVGS